MSSSTPTLTNDGSCGVRFNACIFMISLILAILFLPCYAVILCYALRYIVLCVCGALRAIRDMLFGRALDVQIDSIEDDRGHRGSETLIPLVFCGTWMRPPSPTEEAASVGQSEWSSVQPVSVSVSSQVACKSALGVGTAEPAVSAYASTWSPNDFNFSSPIQNLPETAMIAVMIQMPSSILRRLKDRKGLPYNFARPDNALSEFQIGVAQVQYVDTPC